MRCVTVVVTETSRTTARRTRESKCAEPLLAPGYGLPRFRVLCSNQNVSSSYAVDGKSAAFRISLLLVHLFYFSLFHFLDM